MLDRLGKWIKQPFSSSAIISDEEFQKQRAEILQKTPVPVTWLFGKTGSGKSSMVRFLTGSEEAVVGSGFRPETKHSYRFAFPTPEHPVLQFLDTRGLGESHYDPREDIEQFNHETQVMLVTVRVMDNALENVLTPLREIRRAMPTRPVLLVLTCLHEAYPGQQHPEPYPFPDSLLTAEKIPAGLPEKLTTALRHQLNRFEEIANAIVPVDFTQPDDGFDEPNYGGDRLKSAFIELLPDIYRQTFTTLDDVMNSLKDLHERRAAPYITSAALMSATAAAVPVPWIDLPVVAGIQSDLLRRLGNLYDQPMDIQQFLKLSGVVSGPMFLRGMLRETLKIIPGVGSVANAALAFTTTYALGKACCWYFGEVLAGHAPTSDELKSVMAEQMDVAKAVWQKQETQQNQPPT
ncbi:MAG: GTPase domain-containing protein [Planctomycetaceae bacterium]